MDPLAVADAMSKVAQQIPTMALTDADRIAQAAVSLELVVGLQKKADIAVQQGGVGEIPIVPTTTAVPGEGSPAHAKGLGKVHGSSATKGSKPGQPLGSVKATGVTSGMPTPKTAEEKQALVGGALARTGLKAVQALGGKATRRAATSAFREAGGGAKGLLAGAKQTALGIAKQRPVATAVASGFGAGYVGGKMAMAEVRGVGYLTAANEITKGLQRAGEEQS